MKIVQISCHNWQKTMAMIVATLLFFVISVTAAANYTIYPQPHALDYSNAGAAVLTNEVNVVVDPAVDAYTVERLKEVLTQENGIRLNITGKVRKGVSNVVLAVANKKGKALSYAQKQNLPLQNLSPKGKYDSYILSLRKNASGQADVIIVGEHTNAVFYALASLEQMLEQGSKTNNGVEMQQVVISDYSDMEYRGIVEGYYGYPYSFAVKKDLMQFFKRYKMNTYIYGAKSDPYHSGFWREPYPQTITARQEKNGWLTTSMISDLSRLSLETKVNFIWAIHPSSGKAVDYSTVESTRKAVEDVMGKFRLMHQIGVRQFSVFLDDTGWDFNHVNNYRDFFTNLRQALRQEYNVNYTNASDTVKPIHYVPHIYAINFASKKDIKTYFDAISQIPEDIVVYTTGSGVWSSLKNEDFQTMEALMHRPVALWWNYPCNDNKDGRLYTSDMYSNLHEMGLPTPDREIPQCLGIVSNPMQQGTVAKIALFGVADYAWNNRAFEPKSNWRAAFSAIIGKEHAPLYNYLARFLRYEDPESLQNLYNNVKATYPASATATVALLDTLKQIGAAANEMLAMPLRNSSDSLLLQDLQPWLKKLSKMAELGQTLLNLPNVKDEGARWQQYCDVLSTLDAFQTDSTYLVDALEGMGENPPSKLHPVEPSHKYLMPFIKWMVAHAYSLGDNCSTQSKNNGTLIENNEPVSVDCAPVTLLNNAGNVVKSAAGTLTDDGLAYIHTAEPLLMDKGDKATIALLEAVSPLKAVISPKLLKIYKVETSLYGRNYTEIKNAAQIENKPLRYIRFTLKKGTTKLALNKEDFCLTLPVVPQLKVVSIPEGEIWENHTTDRMVDGDYNTFTAIQHGQREGHAYTVELRNTQPVYDVTIAYNLENGDYPQISQVQVSQDQQNWQPLKVKGTDNTVDATLKLPQAVQLNDKVVLLTFDGEGKPARYVRLFIKKPNPHWLRLGEIEVNKQHTDALYVPVVVADGTPVQSLTDGNANTLFTPLHDNSTLTYNLFSATPVNQLIVYAKANGDKGASAQVLVKQGDNLTPLTTIREGVNHINLSSVPQAEAVVIKIQNKNISIAEIIQK